ncbi:hypothetical protein E8E12_008673 [Didymella heteroderae]|uniref:Uncharacterized protein n=1 Tax=Didymella heteroderae TaxID=1769908 RepID=A0A9P4WPS6_9PLEO|nr:hypothetical protein E8E12_008673 [Didymella heteroderae]
MVLILSCVIGKAVFKVYLYSLARSPGANLAAVSQVFQLIENGMMEEKPLQQTSDILIIAESEATATALAGYL